MCHFNSTIFKYTNSEVTWYDVKHTSVNTVCYEVGSSFKVAKRVRSGLRNYHCKVSGACIFSKNNYDKCKLRN